MAHGGHARPPRRAGERNLRSRGPGIAKNKHRIKSSKNRKQKQQQHKPASLKNQIRSAERLLLRKNLPPEIREAQEKKLQDLKNQQELQTRLAIERKISLRYRKIKFFERRKIERRIRRLERQQRSSVDPSAQSTICEQLAHLKEDLQYVRFFPKTEKYVALFVGGDNAEVIEKREKLRQQIKDNLAAAAACGKDLEETASDDDELMDLSEDDFFLSGSSSDEADADDEWTDKSAKEPASSASGKAASGMSSDEKNQRYKADRARMPPPRPNPNSSRGGVYDPARLGKTHQATRRKPEYSTSSQTSSYSRSDPSSRNWVSSSARADHSSNLSSNSDARKPRRKRRPKKKKQAQE